MSPVKIRNFSNNMYYLTHHTVRRSTSISTKLRVVFDNSWKLPTHTHTNFISVNTLLGEVQILLSDLFTILEHLRIHEIVFTTDIQEKYRQIIID